MYYVYEWYVVSTGEIFYVGKGTNNRFRFTDHNKKFKDYLNRFECASRIVAWFKDEKDAFDYEYKHVNELKMTGQCSCNIRDGGFGGSTNWWTDERREWYSQNNVMKAEHQRERMSRLNPMKNPELAERVNSRKRKPVCINGQQYISMREAANHYKITPGSIYRWCKAGHNPQGEECYYVQDNQQPS